MKSDFKLDFGLRQFASIQVAINFLEQPHLNEKIKEYFKKFTKRYYESLDRSDSGWSRHQCSTESQIKKWLDELLDQVELLSHVPRSIKKEIKYMIPKLADRKVAWLEDQHQRILSNIVSMKCPNLDFYCDNLHWTSIGTIDANKTFQCLYDQYKNNPGAVDVIYLFEEACYHYPKDNIVKIWNNCTEKERNILSMENNDYKSGSLISYWRRYVSKSSGTPFEELWNAVAICFNDGNVAALEFYHELSKEVENEDECVEDVDEDDEDDVTDRRLFDEICELINFRFDMDEEFGKRLCNAKYVDLLVYSLKQMSKVSRQELLSDNIDGSRVNLLASFSTFWPWQTITVPILNSSWEYLSSDEYHYYFNTIIMLEMKYEDKEPFLKSETEKNGGKPWCSQDELYDDSYNLRLAYDVWNNTPASHKQDYLRYFDAFSPVSQLSPRKQIPFLAHLMNDEEVREVKKEILQQCVNCCSRFIRRDRYEVVDCFMDIVLRIYEDRALVKRDIQLFNIIVHFPNGLDYTRRAEKLVEWLRHSENVTMNLERPIPHEEFRKLILLIWDKGWLSNLEIQQKGLLQFFEYLGYSQSEMIEFKMFLKSDKEFTNAFESSIDRRLSTDFETLLSCFTFTKEEIKQLMAEA